MDDLTKTRAALAASQRGLLHVIDAVNKHGDKASITAVHRALGEHAGGGVVDERNTLRREAVDLRDTLADMTAQLAEARDEASEKAMQVVTLELRAEDAEAERDALKAAIDADRLHAVIEAALIAYWCLSRGKQADQLDIAAAGSHAYVLVDALRHAGLPIERDEAADPHGVREVVTEALAALDTPTPTEEGSDV